MLSKKQARFSVAIAHLVLYAHAKGYELTQGDAYRDPRNHGEMGTKKSYGHKNSNHKLRLAQDFNLIVNGKLITESIHPVWGELHSYWENHLEGAPMIMSDANHFSFAHNGVI